MADSGSCDFIRYLEENDELQRIKIFVDPVLEIAGFTIRQIWNDLTGTPYAKGGDWIAIVAEKL